MPLPSAPERSLLQHFGRGVATSSPLLDLKFWDLGRVGDLIERDLPGDSRLDHCGVYKLTVPSGYVPRFIPPDEARAVQNVIFPWNLERLKSKWVWKTDTVYIGLAGRHGMPHFCRIRQAGIAVTDAMRHRFAVQSFWWRRVRSRERQGQL